MFGDTLLVFYNAVIACIHDAESILILGPGEAKGELKKRLVRNKLGGRIVKLRRKFDGTSKKRALGNTIEIDPPNVRSADDIATRAAPDS